MNSHNDKSLGFPSQIGHDTFDVCSGGCLWNTKDGIRTFPQGRSDHFLVRRLKLPEHDFLQWPCGKREPEQMQNSTNQNAQEVKQNETQIYSFHNFHSCMVFRRPGGEEWFLINQVTRCHHFTVANAVQMQCQVTGRAKVATAAASQLLAAARPVASMTSAAVSSHLLFCLLPIWHPEYYMASNANHTNHWGLTLGLYVSPS